MKLHGQDLIDQYETEKLMYRRTMARLTSVLETMMVDECVHPAYLAMVAETLQQAWLCAEWIRGWDEQQGIAA